MPTYDLTERTIGDLQREVDRHRGALREIISMCSGQSGTPWKVKELATRVLGEPSAAPATTCACGHDPAYHNPDGTCRIGSGGTNMPTVMCPCGRSAPSASGGDEARCCGRGMVHDDNAAGCIGVCPDCGGTGKRKVTK